MKVRQHFFVYLIILGMLFAGCGGTKQNTFPNNEESIEIDSSLEKSDENSTGFLGNEGNEKNAEKVRKTLEKAISKEEFEWLDSRITSEIDEFEYDWTLDDFYSSLNSDSIEKILGATAPYTPFYVLQDYAEYYSMKMKGISKITEGLKKYNNISLDTFEKAFGCLLLQYEEDASMDDIYCKYGKAESEEIEGFISDVFSEYYAGNTTSYSVIEPYVDTIWDAAKVVYDARPFKEGMLTKLEGFIFITYSEENYENYNSALICVMGQDEGADSFDIHSVCFYNPVVLEGIRDEIGGWNDFSFYSADSTFSIDMDSFIEDDLSRYLDQYGGEILWSTIRTD